MNKVEIIKYLIKQKPRGEAQLGRVKRQIARDFNIRTISNIDLLKFYRQVVKSKKVVGNKDLEKLLKTRSVRTLSGVAPVAVLTKPFPCPGKCAFCPDEKDMPKSYLSNEPAVMRAIGTQFDPYKQVKIRMDALKLTGHNTNKIELIIMGGTWSYFPKPYQNRFIQRCFEAMNRSVQKTPSIKALQSAMKKNENSKHRCVGLTLETRPDYIDIKEIKRMRALGCTKVEIGIQAIDDDILKLNKRGNTVKQFIDATKLLKDAGFKVVYHLMPNLPGSSPKKDVEMYKELFANPNFQPDMVKIYPCVVTKGSQIYRWFKKGKFIPYSDKKLFNALLKMKQITPSYVRIIRLIRDIPVESIIAGSKISNLRQGLQKELKKIDKNCRCIRCREIKNLKSKIKNQNFKIFEYEASGGVEYFLSIEDQEHDKILTFLRLRFNSKDSNILPEISGCAIIRELHTYGELMSLKEKGKVQHSGLGKKLLKESEKISKKNGYKKLAVIAAIGTRGYYRKLGYKLIGTYMIKNL